MAWFALSFRIPWSLRAEPSVKDEGPVHEQYQTQHTRMYIPPRPVDIYTVRIFDPNTQPNLLVQLRRAVEGRGGKVSAELVEGRGFIFSMPPDAMNPLAACVHGHLLEEGCISITKTCLKESRRRCDSVGGSDTECENSEHGEEDVEEHPNLRLQWNWSDMKT